MTGKIIVHIGLPKTATTTLQKQFFPVLADNYKDFLYLGVLHPRSKDRQIDLYNDICKAVFLGELIDVTNSAIKDLLKSRKTILVSEEMFTVSQTYSWKNQLMNLSNLLKGLNYQILVTVREPTSALFSFYTELYDRHSIRVKTKKSFLDVVKYEESFEIFHYQKLSHELINNFEFDRISLFPFEKIIKRDLDDFSKALVGDNFLFHDNFYNNNKKSKNDTYVNAGDLSIADILRITLAKLGLLDSKFTQKIKEFIKPITIKLDTFTIAKKKVIKPTNNEIYELKEFLKNETIALDKYFAIKYE